MNFEYKNNDLLILESGKTLRGWAYEAHCNFRPDEKNTIVEVLRTVWEKDNALQE